MKIEEKVRDIIKEQLGVKDFKDTDRFDGKNILADDLDMIELCMAFEEEFKTNDISDEETAKLITVKDAIDMVIAKTTCICARKKPVTSIKDGHIFCEYCGKPIECVEKG